MELVAKGKKIYMWNALQVNGLNRLVIKKTNYLFHFPCPKTFFQWINKLNKKVNISKVVAVENVAKLSDTQTDGFIHINVVEIYLVIISNYMKEI